MPATNLNRVVLTGNLTRDPELRCTPSGTPVCALRIASNTRRKTNGEWTDQGELLLGHGVGRPGRELRTASSAGAARSPSTAACSGASGPAPTTSSASRWRSSPTPSSSSPPPRTGDAPSEPQAHDAAPRDDDDIPF